jgi:hypothetical protein
MCTSLRRVLVSVVLAVASAGLAVAPVFAAAGPSAAVVAPPASSAVGSGPGAQLWRWVRTIWPESGCGIDPSGQCGSAAPRPGTQAGVMAVPPRPIPAAGGVRP